MASLALAMTHSTTFLQKSIKVVEKIIDDTEKAIKNIENLDERESTFPGQTRKIRKDFAKNHKDEMDDLLDEYKLFCTDMKIITENKHDETVIYMMHNYKTIGRKWKDLYKENKKLNDRIDNKVRMEDGEQKYMKKISFSQIQINLRKTLSLCDSVVTKIDLLVGDLKIDDED